MIGRLTTVILLCTMSLIQTADVPHPINMTVVEVGGSVTLQCPVSLAEIKFFHWYKQSLGYMVQTVATGVYGNINCLGLYQNPRFKVFDQYFFSISNVTKEDEAIYFCQGGTELSQDFIGGYFLAVNDNNQKTVYLKQSPKTASVKMGGSVTLQCSLLSKNKENTDQCPGSHSVYWFRAGSGEFHPGIIYSQKNRKDEQQKRSCAYNLSKTIRNSSDTGTYYCAVVTCGEILFGEGTKVDTTPELDQISLVLGVLLTCCVTVIVVLIFYINRRRVCEHCKGAMNGTQLHGHDKSTVDQTTDLDGEAVNYAALDFSTRKLKRGRIKGDSPQECVYSVVRADYHNQQHPYL